jgi:hypothetical protein
MPAGREPISIRLKALLRSRPDVFDGVRELNVLRE